jgi:hypothetical protein
MLQDYKWVPANDCSGGQMPAAPDPDPGSGFGSGSGSGSGSGIATKGPA